jgi:hypothetical protein
VARRQSSSLLLCPSPPQMPAVVVVDVPWIRRPLLPNLKRWPSPM